MTYSYNNSCINNELLLAEVKARPALYDKHVKEYTDVSYKKILWEQVSEKLFADIWHELGETQREARASEVLKRWNNLRTCFTRELKIMKDPLQNKRKKYMYFDQMVFLLEESPNTLEFQETEISYSPSSIERLEEGTSFAEKIQELKEPKRKKVNAKKQQKNFEKYVQYSINKLKLELFKNKTENSQMDNADGNPKTFDTDADTNFALSLVPMLKIVPLDKKIDAQIELLSILKKYTSNSYSLSNYNIKFEKDDVSDNDDDESDNGVYEDDE